jgi:hypothetical protein
MALIKGDHFILIDGHFRLRVGSENEKRRIQTGSKPHPNPYVEGTVPIIEDVTTRWWRVYVWEGDDPLIDTDKKKDTIDFLRMLSNEALQAITALEEME